MYKIYQSLLLRPIAAVALAGALGCSVTPRSVTAASLAGAPARLAQAPQSETELALPLTVWTERLKRPDPQVIHVLRIDLRDPTIEVIAMPADDPDGAGPAEAALTEPRALAQRFGALAAVNANAFSGVPDADGKTDNRWRPGLPVDIAGVAVRAGALRSGPYPHAGNDLCFWLDQAGQPHFGPYPGDAAGMREAVNAWWGDLVADSQVLPKPGGDRHPRTAVGIDAAGRWLYLVVVDGRQPFVSAGMTTHELATLMVRLGCVRAINLDGGGSSVMLATGSDGTLDIVNRPSGGTPRPVPVLLGVRRRAAAG